MKNESSYDHIFKILLLGDSSVGKTCVLLRYSDDTFNDYHISTIGLDYRLKLVNVSPNTTVKLQLWDSAGQDRFKAITRNYYKGAHGIVLLYDVTSPASFSNIKNWISQIKDNTSDKVKMCIVGNKIDLPEERKVSYEEGVRLASEYNLKFFECSAKNNIGISDIFQYLVDGIYEANKDSLKESRVSLKENKIKKVKCCK
jgi:small GTP-binding protein